MGLRSVMLYSVDDKSTSCYLILSMCTYEIDRGLNQWIGLRDNLQENLSSFMGKSMVSCRISLKPSHSGFQYFDVSQVEESIQIDGCDPRRFCLMESPRKLNG